jgi:hypothetical protein
MSIKRSQSEERRRRRRRGVGEVSALPANSPRFASLATEIAINGAVEALRDDARNRLESP